MTGQVEVADAALVTGVVLLVAGLAAVRGVWSPCGLSMVSAINPFTERSRGHRYWVTACWFVAGSTLGGALLGVVIAAGAALLGFVPSAAALTIGIGCCLLAFASDSRSFPVHLPDHPRQVNEQWLGRYRRWVYASGFGLQIGCGFATYIMTAAVYLTVALGALTGSPALAFATGVTFGVVRGLAVLLSSTARTPAMLRALHRRLASLAPWSLRVVMAVEVMAAGALAYARWGVAGLAGTLAVAGAAGAVAARLSRRPAVVASCPVDVGAPTRTGLHGVSPTTEGSPSWGSSVSAAG